MYVPVKRLPHSKDIPLPAYETAHAAGMDLRAAIEHPIALQPREYKLIPTGLCIAIPQGFVGMLCSRSGLAVRQGVTVMIAPGIIDADYRGELRVALINEGREIFIVNRGDRIAQLLILPVVAQAQWNEVAELEETERGGAGFGSTGTL